MSRQMNQMSDMRSPGFTLKQGQYLAFIDVYTRVNRRPPAEADMQRQFGVTPPSVRQGGCQRQRRDDRILLARLGGHIGQDKQLAAHV